jgi:hypothetical protein
MSHTFRKIAVVASIAGVGALAAPSVFAATPHLSPANTVITSTVKTGTTLAFAGSIDGVGVTVTCTGFTGSGKTPADGLTVKLSAPPKFTGCTDGLGGTDTVTTTGKWSLKANSTGSKLTLNIPEKGATFSSSALAGCKITVAPTKASSISGTYNNVSTWTISKSAFPISGSGCSTGATATATATVSFSPAVSVVG